MICLDELGPEGAKSFPGQQPLRPRAPDGHAVRATQAIDDGRRGKGYVFGAFRPATGAAFTAPYDGRTTAHWVDFLGLVEAWVAEMAPDAERIYAIVDNLSTHRTPDALLFSAAHPRPPIPAGRSSSSRPTPPTSI